MRQRQMVDFNTHLNATISCGNPADFEVTFQPVFAQGPTGLMVIPHRRAVVRTDTGQPISIVSDRYALVPHTQILRANPRANLACSLSIAIEELVGRRQSLAAQRRLPRQGSDRCATQGRRSRHRVARSSELTDREIAASGQSIGITVIAYQYSDGEATLWFDDPTRIDIEQFRREFAQHPIKLTMSIAPIILDRQANDD